MSEAVAEVQGLISQDSSNMARRPGTLRELHRALSAAAGSCLLDGLARLTPQHLSNTAQGLGTLRPRGILATERTAAQSARNIPSFRPDGLATLAWSCARFGHYHPALFHAIGLEAGQLLENSQTSWATTGNLREENVGMLLEAFSCFDSCAGLAWQLVERAEANGLFPDGPSLGCLAASCRRRGEDDRRLLEIYASWQRRQGNPALESICLVALARRLSIEGGAEEAVQLLQAASQRLPLDSAADGVWLACGGDSEDLERKAWTIRSGNDYGKELRLLQHAMRATRDPRAVAGVMESFGAEELPSFSKWLKIAGGQKAQVLTAAAKASPKGLALELGLYCGFSALHLSSLMKVVSVEADFVHALIAETLLSFAGVAHEVEIVVGHTEDVMPWLIDKKLSKVGYVFMDQRGSRYHADLDALLQSGVLQDGAVVVADNVLKPGAPRFLWALTRHPAFTTEVLEVTEYAMHNVQDWMTASVYRCFEGEPPEALACEAPPSIRVLEWEAERMRGRSHLPQHGGRGVDFEQWQAFAASMKTAMCEALDVKASPFSDDSGVGLYAGFVCQFCVDRGVWWNHLLGGSRRWAQLSSRLTSQLADQADVTAGIAYLTRDWAEMARRSHAALDQEFCGSWRTSLHELASKLTDIWSDIRNASLCTGMDPVSPRVKSARSARAVLDRDPGSMEVFSARSQKQDRGSIALARAGSAPLGGQSMTSLQLWLKVDRAVQRALHVEAERMRKALETDDPKTLQAMMNWWSANNSSVASAAAAAVSAGSGLLDDGFDEQKETLGSLLLSERLHQRFQYRSFAKGDEAPGLEEPSAGVEEFERLEQALATNFESLQDLRRRLAPMASPAGTLRCPCRKDLLEGAAEVQAMLRRSLSSTPWAMMRYAEEGKPAADVPEDSPEDRQAERRILMTLALATCSGVAAVPYAVFAGAWLWAIAFFGFALANAVLLLNYQRLSLPHVHRRFERQLSHLSSRREQILVEIRDLQRSSQRAGAAHARACIFLQSVNVLRNINYFVLCIKTETQRAAAAAMGGMEGMQESVVLGGLRLLLALLPRCEQRWEAEILADDDCRVAVAALSDRETEPNARLVAESQKRLWILLRMVHLSSVLPIEAQGQLGSLIQRYARPILIEGRVPLQNASALEMTSKTSPKQETLLKAAGNGEKVEKEMPEWMSQALGENWEHCARL
ncbi:COMT [Symbiodinium natans]|uniref:catechol O-methyltransferase n=1 Tax=Symbiodinium natans TaxID=878477 RepID=A0A812L9H3_9DINO|nr:COMT [Symbiodinium natans]